MGSFSKKVKADGRMVEFSFMRIYTVNGAKFFVTTYNIGMNPLLFQMKMENGEWRIANAPHVPEWIFEVENKLSKAIIDNNIGA